MIIFKKVRYKNFLSIGNSFTEVEFTKAPATLVVGHNGAGKSTMLDALSFALFGKSHRNINKPQLVNSINNKDCIVEVEFSVNNSSFKIVRGLKPTLFEIWKDGTMLNQNSHTKEYQKILEQNILKLNHKSFHQIVVLGSSSFVPFMQLMAHNRRAVIEDLLDINVFSKMNTLLKEKVAETKSALNANEHEQHIVETKLESQEKYLREIEKINKGYREEKLERRKDLEEERDELQKANDAIVASMGRSREEIEREKRCWQSKQKKLAGIESTLENKMKALGKEAKFFNENTSCPTCEQDISEDLKIEKLHDAKNNGFELKDALEKLETVINEHDELRLKIEEDLNFLIEQERALHTNTSSITRIQNDVASIDNELAGLDDSSGDLSSAKADITSLYNEKRGLQEAKLILNEKAQYNTALAEMLKDTGIKTKIIKQYLPVMNQLINSYLQTLDFFVHFNLDENFNETIKSRHRDAFSYDSFSEGEKQRIDLSLLFTWRQIAKMKNSVATNLLILDETFDSSLDQDGVENLMKIIQTLSDDTNVFVISHKADILDSKFAHKLEFVKEKNFSKIKLDS